jgi:hypothetical protein
MRRLCATSESLSSSGTSLSGGLSNSGACCSGNSVVSSFDPAGRRSSRLLKMLDYVLLQLCDEHLPQRTSAGHIDQPWVNAGRMELVITG